jgi:hypothetical protein
MGRYVLLSSCQFSCLNSGYGSSVAGVPGWQMRNCFGIVGACQFQSDNNKLATLSLQQSDKIATTAPTLEISGGASHEGNALSNNDPRR